MVPALATTTFGAGSGLLAPLLSGQIEFSISVSLRIDQGEATNNGSHLGTIALAFFSNNSNHPKVMASEIVLDQRNSSSVLPQ